MAKKTIGYVHLEWTCPRCETRNPGPNKFCTACGAPQPQDVEFVQAAEEKLLTDGDEIARAKAGPDVHCPYCTSRNPGGSRFCGACGGDLAGGEKRSAGRVVGAHRAGPAQPTACPTCGQANPAQAARCSACGAALAAPPSPAPPPPRVGARAPRGLAIGGAVLGVLCLAAVAAILILGGRTQEVIGHVEQAAWSRTVAVEAWVMVEAEDWREAIPAESEILDCRLEFRQTVDEPVPGAIETCGTPYTIDTGGGFGEVVQDCVYEVYDDWCTYTTMAWQTVDSYTASGTDLSPYWPHITLESGEREGEVEEEYTVTFRTPDGTVTYEPGDETEFSAFELGSEWLLEVTALGGVRSVEPVR